MLDTTNGVLQIMDPTGHTEIAWNPRDTTETTTAREMFETMIGKGYQAFEVRGNGEKGKRMTEFDPAAKKVLMIPQIVGG